MADEAPVAEAKPKKPIVKIILAVVGLIVLVVGVMMGTMFMTGVFDKKPVASAEEQLDEGGGGGAEHGGPKAEGHGEKPAEAKAEGHGEKKADAKEGGHGEKKADGKDDKKTKKTPGSDRFEYTYLQLEREFLVNVSGSKKVMSVQLALMTHYDERVFENAKKHDFALRSVIMDVIRQTTEADLVTPDFRKELAVRIRDAMNSLIEKYEGFGGIEDVFFTSFIVQ